MTTTTATKARAHLSGLLQRVVNGEDIRIMYKGQVVALRLVEMTPAEYVQSEYGLSPKEWKRVAKKLHAEAAEERRAGRTKLFTGDIEDALRD